VRKSRTRNVIACRDAAIQVLLPTRPGIVNRSVHKLSFLGFDYNTVGWFFPNLRQLKWFAWIGIVRTAVLILLPAVFIHETTMPRLDSQNFRKASQEELLDKAKEVVNEEIQRCTVFESDRLDALPIFDKSELVLGRVVGRGGFAICQEITAIKLKQASASITMQTSEQSTSKRSASNGNKKIKGSMSERSINASSSGSETERERLARRVWAKKGDKYVIKLLNHETLHTNKVTYLKGTVDLALETHYLASLDHDHILTLRGLAKTTPFDPDGGYFLILDHLQETLPRRLFSWMHQHRATKGVTGLFTGGKRKIAKLYLERLLVALDVADAMDYLHRKRIMYRDLKPDNIGFAADSTLKLFDFGLARQIREIDRIEGTDLYRYTPVTGAIRYMSCEVGLRKPYNHKTDVYSWAMLFHYIIALEPPMGAYSPKMFFERVFQLGYRPAVKEKWSPTIRELMRQSWSENIDERPEFSDIMRQLRLEITSVNPDAGSFLSEQICEASDVEEAPTKHSG
jgi:serine/threonine protein kinase